jgi:hypothetical protein
MSIDMDKQQSLMSSQQSDTLTWSIQAEAIPRFGRNNRFDNKPYNVIQFNNLGNVYNTSSAGTSFYSLAITASAHVQQFGSWATVFDQYRIVECEIWMFPNSSTAFGSSSTALLYTAIDYDDAIAPTSVSTLQQYHNVTASPVGTNGVYRKWQPHIAVGAYGAGAFTSYKNETASWIDVASANVQHYGFKAGADTTANAIAYLVCVRIWVQFRNVF